MSAGAEDADRVATFEALRPQLAGRAYRLLGDLAEADDVVQDAWLRWSQADRSASPITNPAAWLTTVTTRLALDRLRRRKREELRYVGPWLPTPIVERATDPADLAELTDSMTTAFLIMLERLTPDERAAFLMADVFGERFDAIAETMQRSPAACRQLASRARRKLGNAHQQRADAARASTQVVRTFLAALASGDERTAISCLADDAVYLSDGGPNRRAARRPVRRPDRIVRLLSNLWRRWPSAWQVVPAKVGGFPGIVIEGSGPERRVLSVTGVEVHQGKIVRITSVINPDKLAGVGRDPATLA